MKIERLNRRKVYGLYEPAERPKACPGCNSTSTKIVSLHETLETRVRKRQCTLCGKVFSTNTLLTGMPSFVANMSM